MSVNVLSVLCVCAAYVCVCVFVRSLWGVAERQLGRSSRLFAVQHVEQA